MMRMMIALIALVAAAAHASEGGLELHAHLFMKEGMGWMMTGGFDGPIQARSWKDKFRSQANPETLEASGLDVVVVTLYAHPLLTWDLRESVRRQIDQAEAFARTHPNWVIARDAAEARRALAAGKRVLILALEGAAGILENEADLKEFVDGRGIRIVNLLHLTDDHFGGVALLAGFRGLTSPWAWVKALFSPRTSEGALANPAGLTAEGLEFARALLRRGVWLDLAHASDRAQRELRPLLRAAGQPLLYTHTALRRYHGAERALSDEQLGWVRDDGGFVGLMASPEMLVGTPLEDPRCEGTAASLARQYKDAAEVVGPESVALGSDFNGGIPHLKPGCPEGVLREGFWNISLSREVWAALRALGAPVPAPLSRARDRFLALWEKAGRKVSL